MSAQVTIHIEQNDVNKFNIRIKTNEGVAATEKELRMADKISRGVEMFGDVCAIVCERAEGGAK